MFARSINRKVAFTVALLLLITFLLLKLVTTARFQHPDVQYPSETRVKTAHDERFFATVYEDDSAVPKNSKKIPRIIHQMYKSSKIPMRSQSFVQSWQRNHPNWSYVFWTDKSADEFVKKHYPQYYCKFINFSPKKKRHIPMYRRDLVRYLILHFYGGVYADLDMESLQSVESLRHHQAVISREPAFFAVSIGRDTNVQAGNALMMSVPGHPIWPAVMTTVMERLALGDDVDLIFATGPTAVCDSLRQYQRSRPWSQTANGTVFLAPSPYFYKRLPWMYGKQRLSMVAISCKRKNWKNPTASEICAYYRQHKKLDWRHEPSNAPVYALHHGSQLHDSDRLSISRSGVVDIRDTIKGAIFYKLLKFS